MDFTLPQLSVAIVMTWKCHLDDSTEARYNMILGRDQLTELGLNSKWSDHVIEAYDGLLKVSTAPIVHFGPYELIVLINGKLHVKNRLLMLT